ncbi:MAG: hypothetical protein IT204_07575 [Fimbriimonadaceae bacterium]|nr:hypothetical protein [Fimbriimonadaceae bacterium]
MRWFRALLLGLLLTPANAWWVVHMERVRAGPYVTSISLFANAVFLLTLLSAGNRVVRRWRPAAALQPGELLLVYSMVCLASGVAGMDFMQVLVMILGHAKQFATPENGWESFFVFLPRWLLVWDPEALARYHSGHSSLWLRENWHPYLVPSVAWMTFVAALLLTMQGVNSLLARPWIERERLTYPTLEMPLAVVRESDRFFRQPVFLAGLAIPLLWGGLNGLHFLYPGVPEIPVRPFDLVEGATARPLKAMVWMPVTFFPFAIGLGYFLPTDLLFSAWFFYLFWKAEAAVCALLAWDVNPLMPYPSQQALGACLALVGYLTWTSRGYLRELLAGLRRQGPSAALCGEFRWAVGATLLGAAYLVGFTRLAGLSWPILILFWGLYATVVLVVTRMRAELGPPVHDFHRMGPELMLSQSLGSQNLSPRDCGVLSLFWWFNRAYRGLPMAHQAEGLKAAVETGVPLGWYQAGLWLAGVIGAATALVAYLALAFEKGAAAGFHSGFGYGWANFGQLFAWLSRPTPPDHAATAAIGVGFAFSSLLLLLRLRFLGWPFHPIGFAIASSWSINLVWLPLLLAWALKTGTIRWSGLSGYTRLRPFFLGLILGDCLMGSFWALVGALLGIPTYSFWGA